MATGYTMDIAKGITFEKFALNCARAFGACVTMREESLNTPIPDEFEISTYHRDQIKIDEGNLKLINQLTDETIEDMARGSLDKAIREYNKDVGRREKLLIKYKVMLKKVNAWKPPSKKHVEYKEFMIKQITSSMDWDCRIDTDDYPKKQTGKQYKAAEIQNLLWSIKYHTKSYKEEVERVNGQNLWIKQLRDSLK